MYNNQNDQGYEYIWDPDRLMILMGFNFLHQIGVTISGKNSIVVDYSEPGMLDPVKVGTAMSLVAAMNGMITEDVSAVCNATIMVTSREPLN